MAGADEVKPVPPAPEDQALEEYLEQQQQTEAELIEQELRDEAAPEDREPEAEPQRAVRVPASPKERKKRPPKVLVKPLPKPITRHFRDDTTDARIKPAKFFDYWRSLMEKPEYHDRVVVYLYRIWPVMKQGHRQADKLYEYVSQDDLLRMYGAGDYHLKLNDSDMGLSNVTTCTIRNLGGRDLSQHRPVLDLDHLEVTDPLNQSYITWCRSQGIQVPGDEGFRSRKENEDDMANVEAVKELASTVNRMTDRMLTVAEEKAKRAETEKSRSAAGDADIAARSLEVIKAATEGAAQIMNKGVEQALKIQPTAQNPTAVLKETMQVIREMIPEKPQSDMERLLALMMERDKQYVDRVFQIQEERIRAMETMLARSAAQPQTEPASQNQQPKSLMQSLEELSGVKEKLRDLLGIDDQPAPKSSWTDYIPQIVQGLSILGTVIAGAMYNMAVAKTGQGQPVPPASVPAGAVPPGGAAQPGAAPEGQPQQPAPQGDTTMTQFHQFLGMIRRPLLQSFSDGESGADFAARLIELTDAGMFGEQAQGRIVYDSVLQYGEQVVGTLIKTFPPIWDVVSKAPERWSQFLHEFFTADQIWAAEEAAEAAAAQPPQRKRRSAGSGQPAA
jgi:hypothetical protein